LGEVHVAVNTLENRCFVVQEERPGEVAALMAESTPGRRYVPAFPRTWPDLSARAYPPLAIDLPDRYVHWAIEAVDSLPAGRAPRRGGGRGGGGPGPCGGRRGRAGRRGGARAGPPLSPGRWSGCGASRCRSWPATRSSCWRRGRTCPGSRSAGWCCAASRG